MGGRLQGKVAIVTGAGQGIGEATARAFAAQGAATVIAELNPETGEAVADELRSSGAQALFVETDVTSKAAVAAMVARTIEAFGGVDILVNNAGANVFYEPLAMPDEEWERCLKLDLEAAWLCAKAVLPTMLEQGRRRDRQHRELPRLPDHPAHLPLSGRQACASRPDARARHRIRGPRHKGERDRARATSRRRSPKPTGTPFPTPPRRSGEPMTSIRPSESAGRRRSP